MKLLLVEDDDIFASFVEWIVEPDEVVRATSLAMALELLAAEHGLDAILLDLKLGDSAGLETFLAARAATDLPILAMSAWTEIGRAHV